MSTFVTSKEMAEHLRLNPNTVSNLAANGDIPEFKISKSWRFDWDEVMEKIEASKGE